MKDRSVSVIIVSYNCEKFIGKCVSSVLKNLPENGEVIVLDNDSSDKTYQILEKFLPKIQLIKSDKNLGFAKGNNLAAEKTNGEFIFFLNPDIRIKSPVLEEMIEFYENHADAGIVAPKLIMPNGEVQASVKNLPTIWGAIKEFIFGIRYAYSEYAPKNENPVEVEAVYGAAMLIQKELFEQVGSFDERYFLYYEDIDLCKRIKQLGKKIYYYPKAEIIHLVGATKSTKDRYSLNLESANIYHGKLNTLLLNLILQVPRLLRRLSLS